MQPDLIVPPEDINLRRGRKNKVSRWDKSETNIKRLKNDTNPPQLLRTNVRFPDTAPVFFSGCSNLDVSVLDHDDSTFKIKPGNNMHSQFPVVASCEVPICAPVSNAMAASPGGNSVTIPHPAKIIPPEEPKKLFKKPLIFHSFRLYPPSSDDLRFLPERPVGCKTISVSGFPEGTTEYILKEIFENFGVIKDIEIIMSDVPNQNLCHIRYEKENSIVCAMSMSEYDMEIGNKGEQINTGKLLVQYAETLQDKAEYEHECKIQAENRKKRYNRPSPDASNLGHKCTGKAPLHPRVSNGTSASPSENSLMILNSISHVSKTIANIRTEFSSCRLYLSNSADIRRPSVRPVGCKAISVSDFPEGTDEDILRAIFEQFGVIDNIEMILSDMPNQNFCHIRYEKETAVENAIFMNEFGLRIKNKAEQNYTEKLLVRYAETPQDKADYELECRRRTDNRKKRHNRPSPEPSELDRKRGTFPDKDSQLSRRDTHSEYPLVAGAESPLCVSNSTSASLGINFSATPYPPLVYKPLDLKKYSLMTEKVTKNRTIFTSCSLYPPSTINPRPNFNIPLWCKTIAVGGLPENTTKDILREIFEQFGTINRITVTLLSLPKVNFSHIRYDKRKAVERAISLCDYTLKIGDEDGPANVGKLHVKYVVTSTDKSEYDHEYDVRPYRHKVRHNQFPVYNTHTKTKITESLRVSKNFKDFQEAAGVLTGWLQEGECSKTRRSEFFSWIQGCFSLVRRLQAETGKEEGALQKETERLGMKKKDVEKKCRDVSLVYNEVDKVFKAVQVQKVWDQFSKQQRKNIGSWVKECEQLKNAMSDKLLDFRVEEDMALSDVDEDSLGNVVTGKEAEEESLNDGVVENNGKSEFLNNEVTGKNKSLVDEQNKIQQEEIEMLRKQVSVLQREVEDYKQNSTILQRKLIELLKSGDETSCENGKAYNMSNNINHGVNSIKSSIYSGVTENDIQLVAVISAFLFTQTEGASIDYICAYLKNMGLAVNIKDIVDLLQRFAHIFKEECNENGEYVQSWKFVGNN